MLFRNVVLYGEEVNAEALLNSQVTKVRKMLAMLVADHTMAHTAPSSQNKLHEALALKQLEFQMQDLAPQGA